MQEHEIELLTAFVDGELSEPERTQALQLLHDSSEARGTLWQLQEAAHALKQLPTKKLPADFANKIVETLERQAGAAFTTSPVREPARKRTIVIRWAMAACLLLAVGGLLAFFFRPREQVQIAQNSPLPTPAAGYAFRDLSDNTEREKLAKDLAKENFSRLDVTVHDTGQAIKKMQEVFKMNRIELVVAPAVRGSLNEGKKEDFRILVENLSPKELAGILGDLGEDSSSASIFDNVQVLVMTSEDRIHLAGSLGINTEKLFKESQEEEFSKFNIVPIEPDAQKGKVALSPPIGTAERLGMILPGKNDSPSSPQSAEMRKIS